MFFKWPGNKERLHKKIVSYFPDFISGDYYEPFLGAGGIFFNLNFKLNQKIYLNDLNEELIKVYLCIKNDHHEVISKLEEHKKNHSKEYYLSIRGMDRAKNFQSINQIDKTARFIYLAQTCFNGVYRLNSKGYFNVPPGEYKNPNIVKSKEIKEASRILNNFKIFFSSSDWSDVVENVKPGDFIYLDPPYFNKYNSYTSQKWDDKKEINKILDFLSYCKSKGICCLLSNSLDSKTFFKEFEVIELETRTSMAAKTSSRRNINEILVFTY